MKKWIRVIVFLVILLLLVGRTYQILSWKDTTGDYLSVTQQLYATPKDHIDVVFAGSSHCYCGINPSVLWEEYGISAFDMAVSGQDKDSTYHGLVEVFKTQSPKVVCVDAWGLFFEEHEDQGNVYRNMLALRTSGNSVELVQDYVPKEERGDFYLRWPIVHTRYAELTEYDFVQYEPSIYGRGFFPNYNVAVVEEPIATFSCKEVIPLSERNKAWIDDLNALAKEHDATLMMVNAPMYMTEEGQALLNGAQEYLEEQGIVFFDFNRLGKKIKLDYKRDFADALHLNSYGARKMTGYLGEYLSENFILKDHRSDPSYSLWNECSAYLQHMDAEELLKAEMEYETYLETIAQMQDTVVILSLDGNYQASETELNKVMEIFGIPESEYWIGGKWIFEDGACTYYMNSNNPEAYMMELSEFDTLRMRYVPGSNAQIEINTTPMDSTLNGLNIVVYDKVLDRTISQKGFE